MYIAYFDETGDDGYPTYSSKAFALTSCYIDHQRWQDTYKKLSILKKNIKRNFDIPIKTEIHTKELLLGKGIYTEFNFTEEQKIAIIKLIAESISDLEVKCINVVIDKTKINTRNEKDYKNILDVSLKFNIQRIENDLKRIDSNNRFLIITDEGRIKKMRQTARKIQKFNYVPSRFEKASYRNEIKTLIEDPLPKDSKESYFIQIVDFISYFTYLYILKTKNIDKWHNRLNWLGIEDVIEIMDIISPVLNTEACKSNPYGVVLYPK